MSESSVKSDILKRLTCPVCLDRYKMPKLLPCQHTLCLTPCLTSIVDRVSRRIKCPECRMIHNVPLQGVEAFPNNITIMRFLDLDLTSIPTNSRSNETTSSNSIQDKCFQCAQKLNNLIKCLDCEKFFCFNCQALHLTQLKSEAKQSVSNLRRILPNLSQNLGIYEIKKNLISQNFDSIKKDISSVIEKLIEDLRIREKGLHSEAEVYMQSQLRTISIEKENAEFDLATVTSFCDSSEAALNNSGQTLDNEVCLIRKQSISILEQMRAQNQTTTEANKLIFQATDLNDLSNYIASFGLLLQLTDNQLLNRSLNLTTLNQESNRSRDLTNRNITRTNLNELRNANIIDSATNRSVQPVSERANRSVHFNERHIFGGTDATRANQQRDVPHTQHLQRVQTPVSFNINHETPRTTNRSDNNIITNTNSNRANLINAQSSNLINASREQHQREVTQSQIRSNTFVLDNSETSNQSSSNNNGNTIRAVNMNGAIQASVVRRRPKTPMTFNIMLDDDASNSMFDEVDSNLIQSNGSSLNPKINYRNKRKPKLIFGKQGKSNSEFVWPVDVAINSFNGQMIISDSNNHRIQIFESDGKFIKSFGQHGVKDSQFNCVSGIFIDSMSNIFVVDRLNHRIQIFDRYCRFVRSIGSGQGSAPGQLNTPWGISVSRDKSEIFVCDKENDRISVFHMSGRFIRSFGTHGSGVGQLDKPYYLHIRDNKVLVSDCSNHRIQVFDTMGYPLFSFGSEGVNNGQFKYPRGITTDADGFILVADSGNARVQVFRSDGSYFTHFGGAQGNEPGKFHGLEGIEINKNGEVIVCDKENHRIQIF